VVTQGISLVVLTWLVRQHGLRESKCLKMNWWGKEEGIKHVNALVELLSSTIGTTLLLRKLEMEMEMEM
jgi:hypothetical protein